MTPDIDYADSSGYFKGDTFRMYVHGVQTAVTVVLNHYNDFYDVKTGLAGYPHLVMSKDELDARVFNGQGQKGH